MKVIIENSLANSFSYEEYRGHISNLFDAAKVTGNEQSQDLLHYTELNNARMNRLDKTIKITNNVRSFLEHLDKEYIWLAISESWCGDAAQILPIVNKMALLSDKIEFKIVLRYTNNDLMNEFLTNGSKSIPVIILIEKETLKVINHFGPRPKLAAKLVSNYKEKFGVIDATLKTDLQKWYLSDKGISTQNEIIDLMKP